MRHSKPFQFLRQDLVARIAQQANVELIEALRVIVDGELGFCRARVQTEGRLCAVRGIGPARWFLGSIFDGSVCFVESGRRCRQAPSGEQGGRGAGVGDEGASGAGHRPGGTD